MEITLVLALKLVLAVVSTLSVLVCMAFWVK